MTWLKRNRVALIALAVLIPGALVAALSINAFRYYGDLSQRGELIANGDTGTLTVQTYDPDPSDEESASPPPVETYTATVTLVSYTVVPWDSDTGREVGLAEGREAVSAIIDVDATGLPENVFGCGAALSAPGPDGRRVWDDGTFEIDYYPSGDLYASCDLSSGEKFSWEAVFVVPEGVGDGADLEINLGGIQPRPVLRLAH